ncbi:hypothetical protein DVU_3394 [Nitratidesulfovibrio vulgaris str. Hildenborough]|uniref:Uncharacterized protein n=1 Tax=Nitratidesulfovibrio vulgaris (strain ATCC 29579 / DSM 644 / CCUG 34227 / NCIMB 8303 / VKM B-1760 / Hildenborough) TaxID=882 RepID=Q725N0_NITV2|nr:hypothetical protein DVU_3394 [Nitratidesulfovibrio vulgaris str. Hildenborough]
MVRTGLRTMSYLIKTYRYKRYEHRNQLTPEQLPDRQNKKLPYRSPTHGKPERHTPADST